jgi:hypothetical protein
MAIRNPAVKASAVIPPHITTRILSRGGGFCRRAVYSRGKHVGYTLSRLGAHQAFTGSRTTQKPVPTPNGDPLFAYLSNAVVAVAEAADVQSPRIPV